MDVGWREPYTEGRRESPHAVVFFGIGIVLRIENADVKAGDHIYGFFRE